MIDTTNIEIIFGIIGVAFGVLGIIVTSLFHKNDKLKLLGVTLIVGGLFLLIGSYFLNNSGTQFNKLLQ